MAKGVEGPRRDRWGREIPEPDPERVRHWLRVLGAPEDWDPEDYRICVLAGACALMGGRDLTHPERAKLRPLEGSPLRLATLYAIEEAWRALWPAAPVCRPSSGGRPLGSAAWCNESQVCWRAEKRWVAGLWGEQDRADDFS